MYTHCQQLDALGGRAAPSALALANGSARGGRGKSISSPPVRGAVRNIVFRQTVCVLCWALGIALVLALGYICHRLWLGRANFLATIVPMSFAILALACVPHRLILGKNRHPLAFQQIGLSQAAFSLSVAFLPLLIVQVLNDAQRIWWLLAWLSLTIMLKLGTKPPDLSQADHGAGEGCQGEVEIGAALVTDSEAPEPGEPGEGALHDPPVTAEAGAALDATPCDAWRDAAGATLTAAAAVVVRLVGVKLGGPAPGPPPVSGPYARHSIECGRQHAAVMAIGATQRQAERRTAGICDEMALGAWPAAIRRVRPDLLAPLFADRLALSSAARLQSRAPASCRRSSSTRCSPLQTPAACHSPSRRQQVLPQQPSSVGTSCHWMPVRSTNKMPASAARSGARGRPPLGFGRARGNSGSTANQRSSGTRRAIPPQRLNPGFVPSF